MAEASSNVGDWLDFEKLLERMMKMNFERERGLTNVMKMEKIKIF